MDRSVHELFRHSCLLRKQTNCKNSIIFYNTAHSAQICTLSLLILRKREPAHSFVGLHRVPRFVTYCHAEADATQVSGLSRKRGAPVAEFNRGFNSGLIRLELGCPRSPMISLLWLPHNCRGGDGGGGRRQLVLLTGQVWLTHRRVQVNQTEPPRRRPRQPVTRAVGSTGSWPSNYRVCKLLRRREQPLI